MKNCSDNQPEKLRDSLGPVQWTFMPLKCAAVQNYSFELTL